jgi:hypothetical protein
MGAIFIKALIIDGASDIIIVIISGAIGFGLNSFFPLAI